MYRRGDPSDSEDESFGPGTDLVISLFSMLLLLMALWWHFEQTRTQAEAYLQGHVPRKKQLFVFVESNRKAPQFGKNNAVLTPAAMAELDGEVEHFKHALRSGEYNQLHVVGHASPESAPQERARRERWNLSLSLQRAIAVADHLYRRGIPYECMSVTGFGRSQSEVLGRWMERNPGAGIRQWDDQGQDSSGLDPELFSRERRVEIWGIWQATSRCEISRQDTPASRQAALLRKPAGLPPS